MPNQMSEIDENENKTNQLVDNNDDDSSLDVKDQNFMAEMVEVRVKMYACRVCGIRYDNMEAMRRHYNDIHPTSASMDEDAAAIKIEQRIKEEIMDDEEQEDSHHLDDDVGGYVLVDDNGQHIQLPEGLQVVQIGNGGENGDQIVLQVIDQNENETNIMMPGNELLVGDGQPVVERRKTRQQTAAAALQAANTADPVEEKPKPTPGKRGRKRKSESQPQATVSTRPKRTVVPNIKSEFIYEGINQSIEILTSSKTSKQARLQDSSNYTFVQEESGMITAYQVTDADRKANAGIVVGKTEDSDEQDVSNEFDSPDDGEIENQDDDDDDDDDEDEDESYPPAYTPTFKTAKGRQRVEMKKGDEHLRKFPCPFQGCDYVAKYRSNLWDHKKTHTGEKPYVCNWPSCTMRFSQTHQLKLHLRSHTGERPYVCDWPGCNSAFSQKPGLKSHMLTHTGEKPFKCDYPGCGWTFRLKGALTDHKRAIHENAKKHVCEWPGCNKKFLQQCHLKKHIMGHADIKPFACDWPDCTYRAVTMAYVTNHRKTHTGEKNYECTVPNCGKRFVKSSHVNRHRQRVHPELFQSVMDGNMNAQLDMGSDMDGEDDNDDAHDDSPKNQLKNRNLGMTDDDTNDAVASIETPSSAISSNTRSSRSRSKNQNPDDNEDENVGYMNGNDVDDEESEQASENADKDLMDSHGSLLVELKKEKIDD